MLNFHKIFKAGWELQKHFNIKMAIAADVNFLLLRTQHRLKDITVVSFVSGAPIESFGEICHGWKT